MLIISIVNQKGGTGKTTTTLNLGSALAKNNKKVMLIDLDPQGNLTYSLAINNFDNTIEKILLNETKINKAVIKREGMDVVPSNTDLADVEITISGYKERESLLKNALQSVNSYDYILIDCPPSLSLLTINALNVSHKVIIPLQMEVLSIQGLDQILETIKKVKNVFNKGLEIQGVLPVMVDKRRNLSTEVYEHIQKNFDVYIFKNHIRTNVKATEAPSFGASVIKYAPNSNSAKDYLAFANEIIKLNNNNIDSKQ